MSRSTAAAARLALVVLVVLGAGCGRSGQLDTGGSEIAYPDSPRGGVVDRYHGTEVPDPYRWLEDLEAPATRDWVEAQDELARSWLERLPERAIFSERLARLAELPDPGRIEKQGHFFVTSTRRPDGAQVFTAQHELEGSAEVLLDSSVLGPESAGRRETIVGVRLSPDGRYVAYGVRRGGAGPLELRVRDRDTGRDLPDRISGLDSDLPYWTADSRGLVYWLYREHGSEQSDGIDRASMVAYRALGTAPDVDRVLAESDPQEIGATTWSQLSADGRFVVVMDDLGGQQRVGVLDLVEPLEPRLDGRFVFLNERRDGEYQFAGNVGPTLYFRTGVSAPRQRVVAVDLEEAGASGGPIEMRTVVPEADDVLVHALVAGGHLVLAYRRVATSVLEVVQLDGTRVREIPLPGPGSAFYLSGTPDSPDVTFGFDGFAHPWTNFHHDLRTGETTALGERGLDFDPQTWVSRQVFYASGDGTRVPMFVTHRAGLERTGVTPTLLYGYGASGAMADPYFRDDWFAWIEAGGVLAVANVRGGGVYGEDWHRAAVLGRKQTTFDDFIAAAEFLIAEGTTAPEHLAGLGYSNGGLLVGAVMTQRPELFAAIVPVAGVLDALRFPSLTAGPRWMHEMGDPTVEEQFRWLSDWSPLHALRPGICYPATLVATAANDDVVHASQSYKFAAALQHAQGCERPALLRVYPDGGHDFGLQPGHRDSAEDWLAFVAHHTGLSPASLETRPRR